MSCSVSSGRHFHHVYVHRLAAESAAASRAAKHLTHAAWEVVESFQEIPTEHLTSTTLYLTPHRGHAVKRCPGSRGHLCCNYLTVDLYTGCTLGCSYCIMRSYLNTAPVVVHTDHESILEEILTTVDHNPGQAMRIGTGEVGDSLLLDPLFELSRPLIESLAQIPEVSLELKTKTGAVDHLLDIPAKGNAVIGFSVNPQSIVEEEEGDSPGLRERLAAARRCVDAGYRVSFHFDPIIESADWERTYSEVAQSVAEVDRIAWISMGTFRYTAHLKRKMGTSRLLLREFVQSRDGKYRYLQPRRITMYQHLLGELRGGTGAPVYLCMESPAVWKGVFGALPTEIPGLDGIFNAVRSVY